MHPTLYQISGSFGIHTYGLMILLGLLGAFVFSSICANKVGIDTDELPLMYLLVAIAGVLGARLFYFFFSATEVFFSNPMVFFDFSQGGLVFYGGAIGGVLTGVVYCLLKGIPVLKLADIAAPAIMIGLSLGRVGCFFAGCCHGAEVEHEVSSQLLSFQGGEVVTVDGGPVMALVFFENIGVGSIFNAPTYPTQVWESSGAFLLVLSLFWMWKKLRKFDGQILVTMMIFYAILRSSIEQYRGDSIRGEEVMGVLSTSQSISVITTTLAVLMGIIFWKRGFAPEEPFVRDEEELYY